MKFIRRTHMKQFRRILTAATLSLSIATISYGGTITGSRTAGTRVGTITGSRTGTITGSRVGTITGSGTGTILVSNPQNGRAMAKDEFLSRIFILLLTMGW